MFIIKAKLTCIWWLFPWTRRNYYTPGGKSVNFSQTQGIFHIWTLFPWIIILQGENRSILVKLKVFFIFELNSPELLYYRGELSNSSQTPGIFYIWTLFPWIIILRGRID